MGLTYVISVAQRMLSRCWKKKTCLRIERKSVKCVCSYFCTVNHIWLLLNKQPQKSSVITVRSADWTSLSHIFLCSDERLYKDRVHYRNSYSTHTFLSVPRVLYIVFPLNNTSQGHVTHFLCFILQCFKLILEIMRSENLSSNENLHFFLIKKWY